MINKSKWLFYITILSVLSFVTVALALWIGEFQLSIFRIPEILSAGEGNIEYTVFTKIRMPRILLGFAVGGALSLAGVILQGIYRNPLVEPYTMGISGGAAFGVSVAIVTNIHVTLGSYMLPFSGFSGSILTIALVYFLSIRKGYLRIESMLLIGVMISFIASSAMMLLMSISKSEDVHGIIFWIMGSLDETDTNLIKITIAISTVSLFVSYLFVQPLNALRLGERKAKHLGVNTDLNIRLLFILSSLLTGICVAVAGVIGFVGLVIPHLIRYLVGSDFRILLISSFLGGGSFLILCDTLARVILSPNELPIGVITGIIGGLIFVVVLKQMKK